MPSPPFRLLATLCLFALPCTHLGAQHLFEARPARDHFSELSAGAFAVLDLDGDGDPDVIADDRAYLSDGAGNLVEDASGRMPTSLGTSVRQILARDLDGDGDVDLLLSQDRLVRQLRNDGTGRFTEVTSTHMPPSNAVSNLALADFDGDGDLDLALGQFQWATGGGRVSYLEVQNQLWLNDGSGVFHDATATHLPALPDRTLTTVAADMDGDGDVDLIFGNSTEVRSPPTRLCWNDGSGRFTDAPSTGLPPLSNWWASWLPTAAVDIDLDGDLDLLNGYEYGWESPSEGLLRNDGSGSFSADPSLRAAPSHGIARTDIDGDGDLDLVSASGVFVNDGRGGFHDETALRLPDANFDGVAVAMDWDGDGDADLLFGNGVRHLNDGTGRFRAARTEWAPRSIPYLGNSQGDGIVTADLDGNGEPDVVIGGHVFLQKNGRIVGHAILPLPPHGYERFFGIAALDVDSDLDIDLVCVNGTSTPRLFLNDGAARFTEDTSFRIPPHSGGATYGVIAVDLDGDGNQDLVCAAGGSGVGLCSWSGHDALYLNDGSGHFVELSGSLLPALSDNGAAVAAGDLDGDGDLDLVFANGDFGSSGPGAVIPCNRNRLCLNAGGGSAFFQDASAGRIPPTETNTFAVALLDVDGDSDLDILFGNEREDQLLLNDGHGSFTDVSSTHLPPGSLTTRSISVGDFDEDGDLDVAIAQDESTTARTLLLVNDGTGRFASVGTSLCSLDDLGESTSVALVDLDGDEDLDLVHSSYGFRPGSGCSGTYCGPVGPEGALFLRNLSRQLEAPRLPLVGGTYEIRTLVRSTVPSPVDAAIPMVSPRRASIVLPSVGTLGLDPVPLVVFPGAIVPQPVGEVTTSVGIPSDAFLVGAPFHLQTLVIRAPSNARLTHVVDEVVLR